MSPKKRSLAEKPVAFAPYQIGGAALAMMLESKAAWG